MFHRDGFGIGVDIGGTNLRIAGVDRTGLVTRIHRSSTASVRSPDRMIAFLQKKISEMLAETAAPPHPVSIGVGIPGPYNSNTGVLSSLPNLPGWQNFPLRQTLRDAFPSTYIDVLNDADAAGYGEFCFGSMKSTDSFALLTLGTGLGCSIFIDGKPYVGPGGFSSEIGHIPISITGPRCGCGARGHFESFLSSRQLAVWISTKVREGELTQLPESSYSTEEIQFDLLVRYAGYGDRLATKALERYARYLGRALAVIANLLNMRLTILTGGIAEAWESMRRISLRELRLCSFPEQSRMEVIQSSIGDRAGVLGAAAFAFRQAPGGDENFPFD